LRICIFLVGVLRLLLVLGLGLLSFSLVVVRLRIFWLVLSCLVCSLLVFPRCICLFFLVVFLRMTCSHIFYSVWAVISVFVLLVQNRSVDSVCESCDSINSFSTGHISYAFDFMNLNRNLYQVYRLASLL